MIVRPVHGTARAPASPATMPIRALRSATRRQGSLQEVQAGWPRSVTSRRHQDQGTLTDATA